jgi:hypothetical protein
LHQRRNSYDTKSNVSNININLSIKNVNIIHNPKSEEEPSYENSKKLFKPKAKSVERSELNKTNTQFTLQNGYPNFGVSNSSNLFARKISKESIQRKMT